MNEKLPEEHILEADWKSMSEQDRTEFILRHAVYIELARRRVHVRAVHGSDVRNLLLSMASVFLLAILQAEPTNIIMSILGLQAIVTIASRVLLFFVDAQVDENRVDYAEFLKRKRKKDE